MEPSYDRCQIFSGMGHLYTVMNYLDMKDAL